MSWTNIESVKKLLNKNVLFIDLETTGLVKNAQGFALPPEKKYPSYTENEHYDEARIVQIGYVYYKNFHFENININDIQSVIIKPNKFIIPQKSINIHKITNEIANSNGLKLFDVFKQKLTSILKECDYIIGYNIFFDINILLNELHRSKFNITIEKINKLIKNQNVLCVAILSKEYMITQYGTKYFKKPHAMPNQNAVYKKLFNVSINNAHNAQHDIFATIEILNELIKISSTKNKLLDYYMVTINVSPSKYILNKQWKLYTREEQQTMLLGEYNKITNLQDTSDFTYRFELTKNNFVHLHFVCLSTLDDMETIQNIFHEKFGLQSLDPSICCKYSKSNDKYYAIKYITKHDTNPHLI